VKIYNLELLLSFLYLTRMWMNASAGCRDELTDELENEYLSKTNFTPYSYLVSLYGKAGVS
jgi:hypothetical protein